MKQFLKKYGYRYLLGVAVSLVLLGHAAKLYRIGLLDRLDAIIYDTRLRWTMPGGVDRRIAIVDIDEKSLAKLGHWPWGRDKLAALVNELFDHYHISVLGFDVVFAEPDDSSGLASLDALAKTQLKDSSSFQRTFKTLRPQLDYDARFAKALSGRPVVLGFVLSNNPGANSGTLPAPVLAAGTFAGRDIDVERYSSYDANLAEFQKNAAGAGHFNPLVDSDGVIRRLPMIEEYRGRYYQSLSLAVVRALLGEPRLVPVFPDGGSDLERFALHTSQGILSIPVDENAAALIPFRGPQGSFPYYSAADVLAGRTPLDELRGRIVLVGTTAPGLNDQRSTPVGDTYAGVETHANMIAGMLEGGLKEKPPYVRGADVIQLMLVAVVMVFLLPLLSPLRATLAALVVAGALVGINLSLWRYADLALPLATALVLAISLYALDMAWGYFVESRTKRQFANLFGQYVPPELVEEMSRDPESYSMAGRRAELTVLFSDVRGFTTISEGLQPEQLAQLMNEYLGAMTEVIRRERGTLDKYIGDAIMAFWGAPVADPEHARRAVVAALEMQRRLTEVNRALVAKGWPELKIGIGVNTGPMTVGDMGSPVRKAYTVMGDTVNLGARLEGITKQYGVGIIVGEATRNLLQREFVFRELDRVRVKGKAEPVGIYEPLGPVGGFDQALMEEIESWDRVLGYYRAQDWNRAEQILQELSLGGERYLYQLYLKRIAQYREAPPGEGWDGVTTFETK